MDAIRVLLVDDLESCRRSIERAIGAAADITLVAAATSGAAAVQSAETYRPDIILMDIEMENKYAGITASHLINQRFPEIKIIILTVHQDDNIVCAAFQTGIVDYVIKTAPEAEILEAIRDAYQNRSPIRPMIADKIRSEFQKFKIREEQLLYMVKLISTLTPSEMEILLLLAQGKNKRQLSEIRCVESSTIKKQISSILKKCEQKSIRELLTQLKQLKIIDVLHTLTS